MKHLILVVAALGFSLNHVLGFGLEPLKPALAQLFRCSDESLGEDEREEIRGEDSRAESKVAIGSDCSDANFREYSNERDKREAESQKQQRQFLEKRQQQLSCGFHGINSPQCIDPDLRHQAQQEQERKRQQQLESDRIQQQAKQEADLRERVETARARIRRYQEDIAFWSHRPDMAQSTLQMLPLAEADLQRTEQELQNYLSQRNGK